MYKQNFEHSFGNCCILPLLCKCLPYKISNFKFSENLRPKRPLIHSGPLLRVKKWHCLFLHDDNFVLEVLRNIVVTRYLHVYLRIQSISVCILFSGSVLTLRFCIISCEWIDGIWQNFAYALILTSSRLGLLRVIFRQFAVEVWPLWSLIDLRILFPLNILRINYWTLIIFLIYIDININKI